MNSESFPFNASPPDDLPVTGNSNSEIAVHDAPECVPPCTSQREDASSSSWTPPLPSRASRLPALRSKGSFRGAFIGLHNFVLVYESRLEVMTALVLLARLDLVDLLDQPPAVPYVDDAGVTKTHTFDFLATFADGSKTAVAVKPTEWVEAKNFMATLRLIAGQLPSGFADRVVLITEKDLSPSSVFNARLIYSVKGDPPCESDSVIEALAETLHGATTVGSLIRASGYGGKAFRAVVRLIACGVLELTVPGRIDYDTLVRKTLSQGEQHAAA